MLEKILCFFLGHRWKKAPEPSKEDWDEYYENYPISHWPVKKFCIRCDKTEDLYVWVPGSLIEE